MMKFLKWRFQVISRFLVNLVNFTFSGPSTLQNHWYSLGIIGVFAIPPFSCKPWFSSKKLKSGRKSLIPHFRIFSENHILRKKGPRAPETPKKGWNCIGFKGPGASGPRGTKKREKLRKPRKTFCVFGENSDFMQKVGNSSKITILRSPETLVIPVVYWSFK